MEEEQLQAVDGARSTRARKRKAVSYNEEHVDDDEEMGNNDNDGDSDSENVFVQTEELQTTKLLKDGNFVEFSQAHPRNVHKGQVKQYIDAEQSIAARQSIRQQYKMLEKHTLDNFSAYTDVLDQNHTILMEAQDENLSSIKHTSEALPDMKQVHRNAKIILQRTKNLDKQRAKHTPDELVKALLSRFEHGEESCINWSTVGSWASPFLRHVPAISFMNGALELEHVVKQRKKARSRMVEPEAEFTLQNEKVDDEKTQTDNRVKTLKAILQSLGRPISVFELVVNPESFTQSVENVFDLSFLVKNWKASISMLDDIPMVEDSEEPAAIGEEEVPQALQAIVKFNVRIWLDAIKKFNIHQSCVPTRPIV